MNIDKIIIAYNDDKELLLKKIAYYNLILPDYMQKQADYLYNTLTDEEKANIVGKYTELANRIAEVDGKYGSVIIDFFKNKIIDVFQIPSHVSFDVSNTPFGEEDDIESETNFENIELDDETTERLLPYINHYIIKNSLVCGATFYNETKMFSEIKNELNSLEEGLFDDIEKFLKYSLLITFMAIPEREQLPYIAGNVKNDYREDKIKIMASGKNFVITCHEMLKGVYDIYNEKTFLNPDIENHVYYQKYLRKICNDFYIENWLWTFSYIFWMDLEEKKKGNQTDFEFAQQVFIQSYESLLNYLLEN